MAKVPAPISPAQDMNSCDQRANQMADGWTDALRSDFQAMRRVHRVLLLVPADRPAPQAIVSSQSHYNISLVHRVSFVLGLRLLPDFSSLSSSSLSSLILDSSSPSSSASSS